MVAIFEIQSKQKVLLGLVKCKRKRENLSHFLIFMLQKLERLDSL